MDDGAWRALSPYFQKYSKPFVKAAAKQYKKKLKAGINDPISHVNLTQVVCILSLCADDPIVAWNKAKKVVLAYYCHVQISKNKRKQQQRLLDRQIVDLQQVGGSDDPPSQTIRGQLIQIARPPPRLPLAAVLAFRSRNTQQLSNNIRRSTRSTGYICRSCGLGFHQQKDLDQHRTNCPSNQSSSSS
jgi:hypothetical protein